MTENEAIVILRNNFPKTCKMVDGRYKGGFGDVECEFGKALLLSISTLEEIQKYRAIGTVEECREVMERQRAKKPIKIAPCKSVNYFKCSSCGEFLSIGKPFCKECGNAVDWSGEID